MFCIGKATDYESLQPVTQIPFSSKRKWTRYETLLGTAYATQAEAESAAIEAEQYNGYKFVVLVIGTAQSKAQWLKNKLAR